MNAMTVQRGLFFSAAVVALVLVLFGIQFPLIDQVLILAVFVVLTGLPHGTLDPWIAKRKGLWNKPIGLFLFLMFYLSSIAITLYLWSLFPGTSLCVFLVISAWHFGKDWQQQFSPKSCFAAGFVVLAAPAVFHAQTVRNLFEQIGSPLSSEIAVTVSWVLFPTAIALLSYETLKNLKHLKMHVVAELLVLIVSAALLSPLLYFVLYFCFQHSPRHMINHAQSMRLRFILINAFVLTAVSIAIGFYGYASLQHLEFTERALKVIFIGLAALTVPHMILIDSSSILGHSHERYS